MRADQVATVQPAMPWSIVCVDIEGFTDRRRTDRDRVVIRKGLYHALSTAFTRAEIPWRDCYHEDRGDGMLILVDRDVPKERIARLPRALVAALREHNDSHEAETRIKLRAAIHAGEIHHDDHGVTGTGLNDTFRLLDTHELRTALRNSPGVLALITSEWFFDHVVRHDPQNAPETYRPARVALKRAKATAWLCLPDYPDRLRWSRQSRLPTYTSVLVLAATLAAPLAGDTITARQCSNRITSGSPLEGHTGAVGWVAFSPDGRIIATNGADDAVRLWDTKTKRPVSTPLKSHVEVTTGRLPSVAFSPDGTTLATVTGDTVRLWRVKTGEPVGQLDGHGQEVESVAYSPDGTTLATGSRDDTARLWNTKTGDPLTPPLAGHSEDVLSVAFNPDGTTLATGSRDDTARLWNTKTGDPLTPPLAGHSENVLSVAFHPDGTTLATGSWDTTVRLWDVQTGEPRGAPLIDHVGFVWSVAFSPDGTTLATASADKTVRLWRLCPPRTPA